MKDQGRWLPLVYGVIFAAGLALSGMVQPEKVIGFLDVSGAWDPSLAFVMLGAVGVYALTRWRLVPAARPLVAATYASPEARRIDARLVTGAAIFGVGWGLVGLCPGPALAALGGGTRAALWFVPAMLVGMQLHDRWSAALHRSIAPVEELNAGGLPPRRPTVTPFRDPLLREPPRNRPGADRSPRV